MYFKTVRFLIFCYWIFVFFSTVLSCSHTEICQLEVTATAYSPLHKRNYTANPAIGAWGDTLYPTTRAVAVSRDLIPQGLKHQTEVKIKGFEESFLVLDKMHGRWTRRIDIFMGDDYNGAIEWGKQKVIIEWK